MSSLPFDMKLNGHAVIGRLSLDPFRPDVRAILEIPEIGPVREAFLNYLEAQSPAPMVLEWSTAEDEDSPPVHHRVEGKILNTQFPDAQRAIFQNYE